jgi:hypothetical protein
VASVEAVVKLWYGSNTGTSNWKVYGWRGSVTERFRVCHFDTFENSRFIEIEPVAKEVEGGHAQSSVNVFKAMVSAWRW